MIFWLKSSRLCYTGGESARDFPMVREQFQNTAFFVAAVRMILIRQETKIPNLMALFLHNML
jgi:hypothetical protein